MNSDSENEEDGSNSKINVKEESDRESEVRVV